MEDHTEKADPEHHRQPGTLQDPGWAVANDFDDGGKRRSVGDDCGDGAEPRPVNDFDDGGKPRPVNDFDDGAKPGAIDVDVDVVDDFDDGAKPTGT